MNPQDDTNGMQDLDFSTAADTGAPGAPLTCAACERQILGSYYEVNDQVACEACRYAAETARDEGSGTGRFGRALAAGMGGAVVGAGIYYAVLALTGYEVGLVAIVVGFLVGGGVRWGSRARGGWAYQTLAIVLTYLAIVSTYVPFILQGIEEGFQEAEMEAMAPADPAELDALEAGVAGTGLAPRDGEVVPAAGGDAEPAPAGEDALAAEGAAGVAAPGPEEPLGAGGVLLAVVLIGILAIAAPFLAGFENIIGLAIIGFALYQAWKMNQRQQLTITGPYAVGSARPAGGDAPAPVEGA